MFRSLRQILDYSIRGRKPSGRRTPIKKARPGDTVAIHLAGMLADRTQLAETDEEEPLRFIIGHSAVIPGIQEAVIGMSAGEAKTIVVPADKAYGPYRKSLVKAVDREHFPADAELKVGQRLRIRRSDGTMMATTVRGISGSSVMLDANHPLAGKDLTFEILLLGINRAAAPQPAEDDSPRAMAALDDGRDGTPSHEGASIPRA